MYNQIYNKIYNRKLRFEYTISLKIYYANDNYVCDNSN